MIIKGAMNAFNGSFVREYGDYTVYVTYSTPASGVVLYDFTSKKQSQTEVYHETVKPRSGSSFLVCSTGKIWKSQNRRRIGGSGLGVCFAAYR